MTETRRAFLGKAATIAAGAAALAAASTAVGGSADSRPATDATRRDNGDDERYSRRIASFTKGLPHDELGQVNNAAYDALLDALDSGLPGDFERVVMGGTRPLTNPQAGLASTRSGPDPRHVALPPAPEFASAETAAEIVELYWMALARDVPFLEYGESPVAAAAAAELSALPDFKGPRVEAAVTPETLFRSTLPGTEDGPFMSQFLWLDTPAGAERIDRRIETAVPEVDYVTSYGEWLAVQTGTDVGPGRFDDTRRYVRNGRDLGEWVHNDLPAQAYLGALFTLLDRGAPLDAGNPYNDTAVHDGEVVGRYYRNQSGFATLGEAHIGALVAGVTRPALSAVWFQKWFVHRRLRPETFGGRLHNHLTARADYPIHPDALGSEALERVRQLHGTYLLPQAFPEGSPMHPAYGAGHATVAGAAVTVLKGLFDESFIITDPVEAISTGTGLRRYEGPDLTVGSELNRLAFNIAMGRNFAGIHWRTDFTEAVKLGEEVAIRYLQDELAVLNESRGELSFTRFDGSLASI